MSKIKNIAILGSTGSIGTQALSLVDENPDIRVLAITCGKNLNLLEEQIRKYKPRLAGVWEEEDAKALSLKIKDTDTKVVSGMAGMIEAASYPDVDMVLTAVVGMIGIEPTIAAIDAGKTIALANKETLVCAGHIIMPMAKLRGVDIIPVDSEHSAIFQSLEGNKGNNIKNILLTASGGPFFGKSKAELKSVRVEDALAHPNWSMGAKITIDSATMVNKGLEVIEACHLFNVSHEQIKVLVHRQSILHSAVEYEDGAVIAQLGTPDMRLPIAYALFYPERRNLPGKRLSLTDIGSLTFEKPDMDTFTGLALAMKAIENGGNMPAVFNAANEVAVAEFLSGKIKFLGIPEYIQKAMEAYEYNADPSLEDILAIMENVKEMLLK